MIGYNRINIYRLLNEVVRRKYPQAIHWYHWIGSDASRICYVCEQIIDSTTVDMIRDHGIKHLKEMGLLTFL